MCVTVATDFPSTFQTTAIDELLPDVGNPSGHKTQPPFKLLGNQAFTRASEIDFERRSRCCDSVLRLGVRSLGMLIVSRTRWT